MIIMRHAKSSWESTADNDHERPLNERGNREAVLVGVRLEALDWRPDLVLSSSARRTVETYERLAHAWTEEVAVRYIPEFYLAGHQAIEAQVGELDESVSTVLVLGHNPGWEEAVAHFTGISLRLTTSNACLMSLGEADWSTAVGRTDWTLGTVLRPKDFG